MKKVGVTGLGVICPLGDQVAAVWKAMLEGEVGIDKLQFIDPAPYRVKIGGEIKHRDRIDAFEKEHPGQYERAAVLSILAAQEALENAQLTTSQLEKLRTGSFLGTTMGEVQLAEKMSELNFQNRLSEVKPESFNKVQGSRIAFSVLDFLGLGGPTMVFSNACASGNYAIGWGFEQIRQGHLDMAICGGVDAFSRVAFAGFNRLLSLTPDKCRPFSANRKGLVVSEGVGVLILEDLEAAKARGAHVYCEIIGYGLGMDAFHMTSPHPEGSGAFESMQKAMSQAQLVPQDVDFISAHGTGTPANDKTESIAIKKMFGQDCKIPVNSIKSMIGHTMGAASAIEAVMTCLTLDRGMLLPTMNWETPDENCISDCVPNYSRAFEGKTALSNSFAFGGNTSCLVLKK
jgi:3-oxoacyl-[acyl-carrier-protein] synthase II